MSDPSLRLETLSLYEDLLAIQAGWDIDHPDWLFSQLGYAGALGQQGRLLQAERVFENAPSKMVRIYGETHAISLRCREKLLRSARLLRQISAAIEQCRLCLSSLPIRSGASRKMIHAAIEYHIDSDTLMSANDLFDTAIRLSIGRDSTSDLDWCLADIPFFSSAMVQRGEEDRARSSTSRTGLYFL